MNVVDFSIIAATWRSRKSDNFHKIYQNCIWNSNNNNASSDEEQTTLLSEEEMDSEIVLNGTPNGSGETSNCYLKSGSKPGTGVETELSSTLSGSGEESGICTNRLFLNQSSIMGNIAHSAKSYVGRGRKRACALPLKPVKPADAMRSICIAYKYIFFRISLFLVDLLTRVTNCVMSYTREESFLKGVILLPKETLTRLFCFSNINTCRRLNIAGFMTLPSNPELKCKKTSDAVLTPCSWPFLTVLLVVAITILLGCWTCGLNSSLNEKYEEGVKQLKQFYMLLINDIYSVAGSECMLEDNCCNSKWSTIVRWSKCMIMMPYRIAILNNMKGSKVNFAMMESYINNISDWRLKRNLKRIKVLIRNAQHNLALVTRKSFMLDNQNRYIRELIYLNFTGLKVVKRMIDYTDNEAYETIKIYDKVYSSVHSLTKLRANFENTARDVKACFKCTLKTLSKEIEKISVEANNKMDFFGNSLAKIDKHIHVRINADIDTKQIEKIKNDVRKGSKEINLVVTQLSYVENLPYQMKSEINLIKKFAFDRVESNTNAMSVYEHKIQDRYRRMDESLESRVLSFRNERRDFFENEIIKKMHHALKPLKEHILKSYCENMVDTIKMTVFATVNFGMVNYQKCSLFSLHAGEDEFLIRVDLTTLKHDPINVCCFNQTDTSTRITEAIAIFQADRTDSFDYAAEVNGASVLSVTLSESRPLWFLNHMSSSASEILRPEMNPGNCWNFTEKEISATIEISHRVQVTHVVIEHISQSISLNNSLSDAPNQFQIYIIIDKQTQHSTLAGNFNYSIDGPSLQYFELKKMEPTNLISLRILSNHGNSHFTCLYRFRVIST